MSPKAPCGATPAEGVEKEKSASQLKKEAKRKEKEDKFKEKQEKLAAAAKQPNEKKAAAAEDKKEKEKDTVVLYTSATKTGEKKGEILREYENCFNCCPTDVSFRH